MYAIIPTSRRYASGGFDVLSHRMCARIFTLRRKPVGVLAYILSYFLCLRLKWRVEWFALESTVSVAL